MPHGSKTADRILACAEELFGRRGFDGVAVSEIAESCGVSTGLVYYHFQDKRSLLAAVIARADSLLDTDVRSILKSSGSAAERIRGFVDAYIRLVSERENLLRILIRTVTDEGPERSALLGRTAETIALLHDVIAEGVRTGEFAEIDTSLAAECLFGLMNVRITARALHAPIEEPETADAQALADFIADLFLEGISA